MSNLEEQSDTLADKYKTRREEMGISQGELSRRTGVPQSSISALERGARTLNNEQLAALDSVLFTAAQGYSVSLTLPVDPSSEESVREAIDKHGIPDHSKLRSTKTYLEVVDSLSNGDLLLKNTSGTFFRAVVL